ncbi:putative expansin-B2 [Andrographis paniculata]|uniref:putative expansin-B2 n=1 Tax=Andrographis paniculata TaxID=175694 RepID=UPI0021E6F6FC|nr:putative expansin-B2 [Andrographis paniculata]
MDPYFDDVGSYSFSPSVATWYGEANGAGSGGACGFGDEALGIHPYNSMTAAGNQNLFKSGRGCGTCYEVKCTSHPSCSGSPVKVTITNECPGDCNNEQFHFDLSGKAFGALAKQGQENALRNAGRIDIQHRRVSCLYNVKGITFKIDTGSNRNYLAFVIEYQNGDGDIGSIELLPSNSKQWLVMQQSWGATWKCDLPNGIEGPYSVKFTTIESKKTIVALNAIPANWTPGSSYSSNVNSIFL